MPSLDRWKELIVIRTPFPGGSQDPKDRHACSHLRAGGIFADITSEVLFILPPQGNQDMELMLPEELELS